MRIKDDAKQEALYRAVIEVVNEIGFAAGSVSKIARRAGVSPATLYVYHKNKEELLVSTYIAIKREVSEAVLTDFNPDLPVKDILHRMWNSLYRHAAANGAEFRFAEQFAASPYQKLVKREDVEQYFLPLVEAVERGKQKGEIKDVPFEILGLFMFHPVLLLANKVICEDFTASREQVDLAFDMAWDAIRT